MWERRDLQLIGVLALREIILGLEREGMGSAGDEAKPAPTAGSVCRQNCFTVKVRLAAENNETATTSGGLPFTWHLGATL